MYSGLNPYPTLQVLNRDAGGEGAGGRGAIVFGRSVNPILTRRQIMPTPLLLAPSEFCFWRGLQKMQETSFSQCTIVGRPNTGQKIAARWAGLAMLSCR